MSGYLLVGLTLFAPAGAMAVLRAFPSLDPVFESPAFHLVVVGAIAACAVGIAASAGAAAARVREPAVVLLALACIALGVLMLGHGLSTPGVAGNAVNRWVGRFPVLAIAAFALSLSLAVTATRSSMAAVRRHPVATLAVPTVALVAFVSVVAANSTRLSGTRQLPGEEPVRLVLLAASALALAATGWAYWRRWRLGRDHVQLALAAGAWLSANAAASLELGTLWRLSWWDYHVYLLAGFVASVYSIAKGYARHRTVAEALAGISIADPVEQIEHGHPETLQALVAGVEAKDRYLLGHSARVADLAVRIGLRIRLPLDQLRLIAIGARVHDVGEIGVPDHILNRPGPLTPEEWKWIHEHPVIGSSIVERAASLRGGIDAVRHHHERVDGSGYPDGLSGEDIPLIARIVAVADVYDALISDRSYRSAFSPRQAIAHLWAGRATQFDVGCVDALLGLVAERGVILGPPGHRGGPAESRTGA